MVFKEIDDNLWALIRPNLPAQKPWTGRPRCDLRKTFNGILYVHKTGINWSDVPRMYGTKSTVHKLHLELCKTGAYQKIKLPSGAPITRPKLINGDAAYDTKAIRKYNRKRGLVSNIPVNRRNRKKKKIGRPIKLDKDIYKGRSAVERFFSWIEATKKILPRYERLEDSYLGLVTLSCSMMIWRVLG